MIKNQAKKKREKTIVHYVIHYGIDLLHLDWKSVCLHNFYVCMVLIFFAIFIEILFRHTISIQNG